VTLIEPQGFSTDWSGPSSVRSEGIDAVGEPGDPDPYTATMDAAAEYEPDAIIISTFPATSSGWLRRDLIERVTDAARVPVQHVVADIVANNFLPVGMEQGRVRTAPFLLCMGLFSIFVFRTGARA